MKSLTQGNKYKNFITEYSQVLSEDGKYICISSNKNPSEILYTINIKNSYEEASLEAETVILELKTLKRF